MKTVYVVQGETGDYESHVEWLVCAFDEEEHAKTFVAAMSAEVRELIRKVKGSDNYRNYKEYSINTKSAPEWMKSKLDPNMRVDDGGVTYEYYAIELRTEVVK